MFRVYRTDTEQYIYRHSGHLVFRIHFKRISQTDNGIVFRIIGILRKVIAFFLIFSLYLLF